MSKKYLTITLLIVSIFTFSATAIARAEDDGNLEDMPTITSTPKQKNLERETIRNTYKEKDEALKDSQKQTKETFQTQKQENVQTLKETKDIEAFVERRKQIQTEFKTQTEQFRALREANQEEFKLKRQELLAQAKIDRSVIKDERLDDAKIARLEGLNEKVSQASIRMLKVTEYFYDRLAKISASLDAQEAEGFGDNAEARTNIKATELKIYVVTQKINDFSTKYQNMESLTIEQINALIKTMHSDLKNILEDIKSIKADIKTISKSI